MNLIDLYIGEVTRRLPEKNRQDIALELRSAIEDMLPEDPSEQDVKEVLAAMGNPAVLASGYRDKPMHLIGPRYFDLYISLLKLILPIAITVTLIVVIVVAIFTNSGETTIIDATVSLIGDAISASVNAAMQVFFWLTLVIALIERADRSSSQAPMTMNSKEWTPDDLKEVVYIPKEKAISKFEIAGSLIWTVIWTAGYFNADRLLGVYHNRGEGLEFVAPTFNQDVLLSYWPLIILMLVLEIALAVYKWREGQWTRRVAIFNAVVQIVSTGIIVLILTNSKLVNQAFLDEISSVFGGTSGLSWTIGAIILTVVVVAVSDMYQGFRKAMISPAK